MDPINQALLNTQNAFLAMADRKRQARLDEQMQQQNALAMALQQAQLEEVNQRRQVEEGTRNAYRQRAQFFDGGQPNFPMARPGMDADSFTLDALMQAGNYDLARRIETENEARSDKNLALLIDAAKANKPSYQTVGNDLYQVPGDSTSLSLLASRGITMPGQPQQVQAPGVSLPSMAGFGVGQDVLGMPQGMPQGAPTAAPKKVVSGPRKIVDKIDLGNVVEVVYSDGTVERRAKGRIPGAGGHGGGKPRYVQYTGPDGTSRMINVNDDGERREAESQGWQPGKGKLEKSLPQKAITDLSTKSRVVDNTERFLGSFQPEYGGHYIAGGLSNTVGRLAGDDSGQAQWWQDYSLHESEVRNNLFGSALTGYEVKEWQKTAINPRMHPDQIRKNLARRAQLEKVGLDRLMRGYAAGGYSREQIVELTGREIPAAEPKKGGPPTTNPKPAPAPVSGNRQQMGRPKTANAYLTKWE